MGVRPGILHRSMGGWTRYSVKLYYPPVTDQKLRPSFERGRGQGLGMLENGLKDPYGFLMGTSSPEQHVSN